MVDLGVIVVIALSAVLALVRGLVSEVLSVPICRFRFEELTAWALPP